MYSSFYSYQDLILPLMTKQVKVIVSFLLPAKVGNKFQKQAMYFDFFTESFEKTNKFAYLCVQTHVGMAHRGRPTFDATLTITTNNKNQ